MDREIETYSNVLNLFPGNQMERDFKFNEQISIEPKSNVPRFQTQIIGIKKNCYLLLDLEPSQPILEEGARVSACLLKSPRHRFESEILQVILDPPILVMKYPVFFKSENIERRSSERHEVSIRINLQHGQRVETREGQILNISATGCLVAGDFSRWLNELVSFSFRVPGTQVIIMGMAEIIRGQVTDQGFQYGLSFVDLPQEQEKRLKQFLNSQKCS
jgi:hypothetical protein